MKILTKKEIKDHLNFLKESSNVPAFVDEVYAQAALVPELIERITEIKMILLYLLMDKLNETADLVKKDSNLWK